MVHECNNFFEFLPTIYELNNFIVYNPYKANINIFINNQTKIKVYVNPKYILITDFFDSLPGGTGECFCRMFYTLNPLEYEFQRINQKILINSPFNCYFEINHRNWDFILNRKTHNIYSKEPMPFTLDSRAIRDDGVDLTLIIAWYLNIFLIYSIIFYN